VYRFPVDESSYGVRGMGGNSADWCEDTFQAETKPRVRMGVRDYMAGPHNPSTERVQRGGAWYYSARDCHPANRFSFRPDAPIHCVGIRMARDL